MSDLDDIMAAHQPTDDGMCAVCQADCCSCADDLRSWPCLPYRLAERARNAEAKVAEVEAFAQDCETEVARRHAMRMHGPHLDAAQVAVRIRAALGGDHEQPKPCTYPGCRSPFPMPHCHD